MPDNKYFKTGVLILTAMGCFIAGVVFFHVTVGIADAVTAAFINPCACD